MITYVCYHDNCYDGFGAALAAWLRFGSEAQYMPVQYGRPLPPMASGCTVYFVDFCPDEATLRAVLSFASMVYVLDHHTSSQQLLINVASEGHSNFDYRFSNEKSGALITWENMHPGQVVPILIRYVSDRDLWKFELPHSREVSAALRLYPFRFEVWGKIMHDVTVLKDEGRICLQQQEQAIEAYVKNSARFMDIAGHMVPIVNCSYFFSEAAEELLKRNPEARFAGYYFDRNDGIRQWGLRSVGDFDVSKVAAKFGGGGHKNAAGFQTPI